jgi:hypothetical protein
MAQYTVNIAAEDSYTILINVNGIAEAGRLEVFIDNACFSSTVDPTEEWNYFELKDKDLSAGEHKLKLIWVGNGSIQIGDLWIDYQGDVDLTPTLSYDFEDPANLGKATDGDYDLEIFGAPTQIDGPKSTDKAVYVPQDAYFKAINPLGPAVTGKQLATFSMMWEYRVEGISNGYHCFLQARENNDGDGTFFIRPGDAGIGIGGHYTTAPYVAEEGKWQRVIFSFNDGVATTFVDGKVGYTGNWDVKLGDYFWLFLDNDGEDLPMECARYAYWADVALSQFDLKQMGLDGGITAIKPVAENDGKVYAADGKLFVKGVSASASIEIYSLVGQKIAEVRSLNGRSIDLPAKGMYVVKVSDNGQTKGYKVLSK